MSSKLPLTELIEKLRNDKHVVHWNEIPEKVAETVSFPEQLDIRIQKALVKRNINALYTHQASAFSAAHEKQDFVAVTPTASGKTMCYNLPVLQSVVEDDMARSLYLFPTKALAQDQKSELNELINEIDIPVKSYTYDGDTAPNIRQVVRKAGHVVMTNPDMLHSAILPHHTKWVSLFENLRYVVIDELHIYRGVFGSHVANVIRRLRRICEFYGSNPTFICTSATIANPSQLARELTGKHMKLIDNNGAPSGRKHFAFYNPPIVNKPLNIRKGATTEVTKIAGEFLRNKVDTIVFAKSRVRVEVILSHLQELVKKELGTKSIRAYRGGYLPKQRREIERGLRNGEIRGVVSTNALELGVDIGQLQVCIMTGYPGTVASTWQQAGRAGRRQDEALMIMVANSNPIDQYVVQHPEFFFEKSPENARINPDNLIILVDHLKCAAYELPFRKGETFGGLEVEDVLEFLTEEDVLHKTNGKWYWMNDGFPATNVSLRSASQENVVIVDISERGNRFVIGEMDRFSAMTLLHEEAIYLHDGKQFQVEQLDWEEKKAYVRAVDVEYFTDANLAVQLKVLEEDKSVEENRFTLHYGDVTVNAKATIFKKIKMSSFENIGSGPIHLPEEELHTSSTWLVFNNDIVEIYEKSTLEHALIGISNLLKQIIPVFVMCDGNDVHVVPQMKAVHNEKPTIFMYDRYPGGIGLSEQIYKMHADILREVVKIASSCPCENGCPSCVGIMYDPTEKNIKEAVIHIVARTI
ncbi:DEAD/DEAH box helicase [Bacillus solimangrovi]|uniref:DEAD/DEAH box helicase n=1 Tax=Bacillus solimangrovi TaxID=1305675 RepID=UPI001FE0CF01|nr:DEAD/DEAH box helicase [Bacillus solimangrovi]